MFCKKNKFLGLPKTFIKIETLAHVFFCEFFKISKNTFFAEHVWGTASSAYNIRILTEPTIAVFNTLSVGIVCFIKDYVSHRS